MFSETLDNFFKRFLCCKSKCRTVQNTKKHEKFTIFRLFKQFFTIHFFTFLDSVHRNDEKCYLRLRNKIFMRFLCLKSKFRTVQNTKKHEKFTIFRLFCLSDFSLFTFLKTFLDPVHWNDEKCYLRPGNKIFKEVFMS